MVLGSGELHLLSVPDPHTAPAAAQEQPAGTSTLISGDASGLSASQFVRLQPEASAAASAVRGSLPNVAEWLPRAPHDLLLVCAHQHSVPALVWVSVKSPTRALEGRALSAAIFTNSRYSLPPVVSATATYI